MAKNLIPDIAMLLGVEIGEEFKCKGYHGVFRFTNERLEWKPSADEELWNDSMCTLGSIVKNNDDILIKLPWKPKFNDKFWMYLNSYFMVDWDKWNGSASQLALLKCGMIFRTKEEAIKNRPSIYKELTGKEWAGE